MSHLRKVLSLIAASSLGLAISATTFAGTEAAKEIEKRIKPVGQVCMEGEECAAAPVVVAAAGGEARDGETVYKKSCLSCHSTGAAGAPKLGNAGDWAPRISKGMEVLYANALKGINAMPPKGLCMDCTDEEIKVTVDYIIDNSK